MPPNTTRAPAPMTSLRNLFLDERKVLLAILVNAIVLILLSFPQLATSPPLEVLDYAFTTFFVFEAIVKLRHFGGRAYFGDNWNRFDFLIVLVSLPSYLILFMNIPDLSFLAMLRVARVMRFFRFIRFIPNMAQLIYGIRRAFRASVFVLIAFFLFNLMVSLVATHLFGADHPEYFGNPLISFYSTFKTFTIEGWYEIPDAMAETASPAFDFFIRSFFMAVVIMGGLVGLSLINAIFVDEMLRNENDLFERRLNDLNTKINLLLEERGLPIPDPSPDPDLSAPDALTKTDYEHTKPG